MTVTDISNLGKIIPSGQKTILFAANEGNISTITGSICKVKTDCSSVSEDKRVVCVDGICRCEPNYRWDSVQKVCTEYKCKEDTECQEYDKYRKCDKNKGINSLINFLYPLVFRVAGEQI